MHDGSSSNGAHLQPFMCIELKLSLKTQHCNPCSVCMSLASRTQVRSTFLDLDDGKDCRRLYRELRKAKTETCLPQTLNPKPVLFQEAGSGCIFESAKLRLNVHSRAIHARRDSSTNPDSSTRDSRSADSSRRASMGEFAFPTTPMDSDSLTLTIRAPLVCNFKG